MSILFNHKNESFNLDLFENGSSNKLLILGYSGYVRSTRDKQLAAKYKTKYENL